MTIYAFTETHNSRPAYINISDRKSTPGVLFVTVRSVGEDRASCLALTNEQLQAMADSINKHLSGAGQRFTFDQFVQYGISSTRFIVRGMPWSFRFYGNPVTHENDNHYIIGDGMNFLRGDMLIVHEDGTLSVVSHG